MSRECGDEVRDGMEQIAHQRKAQQKKAQKLMHLSAYLLNHKEETEIKMLFGAFLDFLMLKDRDGIAFWSLTISVLRVAGKYFLSV